MDPLRLRALELARPLKAGPTSIARVARETSEDAARWAFTQIELRGRAQAKFARADAMLFVREALEQATHERVAAYHASRFPVSAPVYDLTTGIGADLIALAARGPTVGFEIDAERAACARFNLSSLAAEVREEDSLAWLSGASDVDYALADPARRVAGRRTLDIAEFEPEPRLLAELFRNLRLGLIKLSPMLSDGALQALGSAVEFVSFDDECREALVFAGREAPVGVSAVHLESGDRLASETAPRAVEMPGPFLFDTDPAAVRAHSLGALCRRHDLRPLGDSNGYLAGDAEVTSPWLRAYRVLYQGKADPKTTRKALRELNAATPELKQRAAHLELTQERATYAGDGSRPLTLAIWPVGRSLRHTILERC